MQLVQWHGSYQGKKLRMSPLVWHAPPPSLCLSRHGYLWLPLLLQLCVPGLHA